MSPDSNVSLHGDSSLESADDIDENSHVRSTSNKLISPTIKNDKKSSGFLKSTRKSLQGILIGHRHKKEEDDILTSDHKKEELSEEYLASLGTQERIKFDDEAIAALAAGKFISSDIIKDAEMKAAREIGYLSLGERKHSLSSGIIKNARKSITKFITSIGDHGNKEGDHHASHHTKNKGANLLDKVENSFEKVGHSIRTSITDIGDKLTVKPNVGTAAGVGALLHTAAHKAERETLKDTGDKIGDALKIKIHQREEHLGLAGKASNALEKSAHDLKSQFEGLGDKLKGQYYKPFPETDSIGHDGNDIIDKTSLAINKTTNSIEASIGELENKLKSHVEPTLNREHGTDPNLTPDVNLASHKPDVIDKTSVTIDKALHSIKSPIDNTVDKLKCPFEGRGDIIDKASATIDKDVHAIKSIDNTEDKLKNPFEGKGGIIDKASATINKAAHVITSPIDNIKDKLKSQFEDVKQRDNEIFSGHFDSPYIVDKVSATLNNTSHSIKSFENIEDNLKSPVEGKSKPNGISSDIDLHLNTPNTSDKISHNNKSLFDDIRYKIDDHNLPENENLSKHLPTPINDNHLLNKDVDSLKSSFENLKNNVSLDPNLKQNVPGNVSALIEKTSTSLDKAAESIKHSVEEMGSEIKNPTVDVNNHLNSNSKSGLLGKVSSTFDKTIHTLASSFDELEDKFKLSPKQPQSPQNVATMQGSKLLDTTPLPGLSTYKESHSDIISLARNSIHNTLHGFAKLNQPKKTLFSENNTDYDVTDQEPKLNPLKYSLKDDLKFLPSSRDKSEYNNAHKTSLKRSSNPVITSIKEANKFADKNQHVNKNKPVTSANEDVMNRDDKIAANKITLLSAEIPKDYSASHQFGQVTSQAPPPDNESYAIHSVRLPSKIPKPPGLIRLSEDEKIKMLGQVLIDTDSPLSSFNGLINRSTDMPYNEGKTAQTESLIKSQNRNVVPQVSTNEVTIESNVDPKTPQSSPKTEHNDLHTITSPHDVKELENEIQTKFLLHSSHPKEDSESPLSDSLLEGRRKLSSPRSSHFTSAASDIKLLININENMTNISVPLSEQDESVLIKSDVDGENEGDDNHDDIYKPATVTQRLKYKFKSFFENKEKQSIEITSPIIISGQEFKHKDDQKLKKSVKDKILEIESRMSSSVLVYPTNIIPKLESHRHSSYQLDETLKPIIPFDKQRDDEKVKFESTIDDDTRFTHLMNIAHGCKSEYASPQPFKDIKLLPGFDRESNTLISSFSSFGSLGDERESIDNLETGITDEETWQIVEREKNESVGINRQKSKIIKNVEIDDKTVDFLQQLERNLLFFSPLPQSKVLLSEQTSSNEMHPKEAQLIKEDIFTKSKDKPIVRFEDQILIMQFPPGYETPKHKKISDKILSPERSTHLSNSQAYTEASGKAQDKDLNDIGTSKRIDQINTKFFDSPKKSKDSDIRLILQSTPISRTQNIHSYKGFEKNEQSIDVDKYASNIREFTPDYDGKYESEQKETVNIYEKRLMIEKHDNYPREIISSRFMCSDQNLQLEKIGNINDPTSKDRIKEFQNSSPDLYNQIVDIEVDSESDDQDGYLCLNNEVEKKKQQSFIRYDEEVIVTRRSPLGNILSVFLETVTPTEAILEAVADHYNVTLISPPSSRPSTGIAFFKEDDSMPPEHTEFPDPLINDYNVPLHLVKLNNIGNDENLEYSQNSPLFRFCEGLRTLLNDPFTRELAYQLSNETCDILDYDIPDYAKTLNNEERQNLLDRLEGQIYWSLERILKRLTSRDFKTYFLDVVEKQVFDRGINVSNIINDRGLGLMIEELAEEIKFYIIGNYQIKFRESIGNNLKNISDLVGLVGRQGDSDIASPASSHKINYRTIYTMIESSINDGLNEYMGIHASSIIDESPRNTLPLKNDDFEFRKNIITPSVIGNVQLISNTEPGDNDDTVLLYSNLPSSPLNALPPQTLIFGSEFFKHPSEDPLLMRSPDSNLMLYETSSNLTQNALNNAIINIHNENTFDAGTKLSHINERSKILIVTMAKSFVDNSFITPGSFADQSFNKISNLSEKDDEDDWEKVSINSQYTISTDKTLSKIDHDPLACDDRVNSSFVSSLNDVKLITSETCSLTTLKGNFYTEKPPIEKFIFGKMSEIRKEIMKPLELSLPNLEMIPPMRLRAAERQESLQSTSSGEIDTFSRSISSVAMRKALNMLELSPLDTSLSHYSLNLETEPEAINVRQQTQKTHQGVFF
ncbi:unnamed protein product [Gordionus sp. m RMFG-2023]